MGGRKRPECITMWMTMADHDSNSPMFRGRDDRSLVHDVFVQHLTVIDASGKILLDGASIDVPCGGCAGFEGPSGSGKTLLMRGALGLLPPSVNAVAGKIRLLGAGVDAQFPSYPDLQMARRKIAYCGQDPFGHFVPDVLIGRQLHALALTRGYTDLGAVQTRMEVLLGELGLLADERVLDAFPRQLSGGQLQRTQIAMALTVNPRVLFLDEPTSSLDPVNVDRLVRLLVAQRGQHGTSLLLASHDPWLIESLCDRVYRVDSGQVRLQ